MHLYTLLVHYAASGSASCGDAGTCPTNLPVVGASSKEVQQILQIIFGALAALSVLMIVIAGLRFITAQGNSSEISKARGTIIYAIAGLVIALIAEAIVGFVLGKL